MEVELEKIGGVLKQWIFYTFDNGAIHEIERIDPKYAWECIYSKKKDY